MKRLARLLENLDEKARTYQQAREEIFAYLKSQGWDVRQGTVVKPLKIPYAIAPGNEYVVWFKKQAVWGHELGYKQTPYFKAARSIFGDIRKMDGPSFVRYTDRWFERTASADEWD